MLRRQVFRAWTALAVLAGFGYAWVTSPELLTWWKRATTHGVEVLSGWLPYPWGDRLESTLGNFGLWVQITLAILLFRLVAWLLFAIPAALLRRRRPPFP
jgi:hypothetical protein